MTKLLTTAAVLLALIAPASADNKLPAELSQLFTFIQREVKGIRSECPGEVNYPMQ